jgi:hypothetical protein
VAVVPAFAFLPACSKLASPILLSHGSVSARAVQRTSSSTSSSRIARGGARTLRCEVLPEGGVSPCVIKVYKLYHYASACYTTVGALIMSVSKANAYLRTIAQRCYASLTIFRNASERLAPLSRKDGGLQTVLAPDIILHCCCCGAHRSSELAVAAAMLCSE